MINYNLNNINFKKLRIILRIKEIILNSIELT